MGGKSQGKGEVYIIDIYFALFPLFIILYEDSCVLPFPKMEYNKIQISYTGHLLMRTLPFHSSFKLTFLMDTNSFSNRPHLILTI